MKCRRSGVSFGGKTIQSQRQVRAVFFNDADWENSQRFARARKTFNFGERNLCQMLHGVTSLSAKHVPELLTPAVHLLAGRQLHDDDLLVFNVFLELVIDFGM